MSVRWLAEYSVNLGQPIALEDATGSRLDVEKRHTRLLSTPLLPNTVQQFNPSPNPDRL